MTIRFPYDLGEHNSTIVLYEGPLDVPLLGATYVGSVQLQWRPRYRTVLLAEGPHELDYTTMARLDELIGRRGIVRIKGLGELEVIFTSSRPITGLIEGSAELSSNRPVSRILFAVPNFPDILLSEVLHYETDAVRGAVAGLVRFSHLEWQVRVEVRTPMHRTLFKELRGESGNAVTHVGELRRRDRAPFPPGDAETILEALTTAFSFARGAWSPVLLPTGMSEDGVVEWRRWNRPRVDSWSGLHSWLDLADGAALKRVMRACLKACTDPCQREALRRGVMYYVEANRSGEGTPLVEARIAIAQAGLELLAWLVLDDGCNQAVGDEQEGASGFNKRLAELLRRAQIPSLVPAELKALNDWIANEPLGLTEGPVSQARVRFIHPRRRGGDFGIPSDAFVETWLLAVWYLELLLLKQLRYEGDYVSRIERGSTYRQAQPVPWTH